MVDLANPYYQVAWSKSVTCMVTTPVVIVTS